MYFSVGKIVTVTVFIFLCSLGTKLKFHTIWWRARQRFQIPSSSALYVTVLWHIMEVLKRHDECNIQGVLPKKNNLVKEWPLRSSLSSDWCLRLFTQIYHILDIFFCISLFLSWTTDLLRGPWCLSSQPCCWALADVLSCPSDGVHWCQLSQEVQPANKLH